jgi:GT2 family glycosyltransferase
MIAIRRELFEQLGLYDDRYFPTYYEEVEFAVRARRAGYRIVYAPRALLYHIESKTEVVKSHKFYFRFHRSRWRFVLKNFTPRGILRALKHEIPHFRATIDPVERNALLRAYGYVLARLPRILYDRNHRFLPLGKRPTRTTQPAMQEAV